MTSDARFIDSLRNDIVRIVVEQSCPHNVIQTVLQRQVIPYAIIFCIMPHGVVDKIIAHFFVHAYFVEGLNNNFII